MPFQSRLFNTTIRQVQCWQDRAGQMWRQVKLQATWGVEALLYPLTRIGQSLRSGLKQHQAQSIADGAKQSSPGKIIRLFKRVGRSFSKGLASLGRLSQRLSLQRHLIQPLQPRNRLNQFAALVRTRSDLPLSAKSFTSLGNGAKQFSPSRVICLFERMGRSLKQHLIRPLQPRNHLKQAAKIARTLESRETSLLWVSRTKTLVKQLIAPLQRLPAPILALRLNQDGESLDVQNSDYGRLTSLWEPDSSSPKAILGWIKAAIIHFFGEGATGAREILSGASRKLEGVASEPDQNLAVLPATSFSMAILPGVENLVRVVWRVIRRGMEVVVPWLGRDLALPMSPPNTEPFATPSLQSLGFSDAPCMQPNLLAEASQGLSWDDGCRLTAPSEAQSPLKTTLIEVSATVVGYVEHPLRLLWTWLDRAIRFLEDVVIDSFTWLWRWIQQAKRYYLDSLN